MNDVSGRYATWSVEFPLTILTTTLDTSASQPRVPTTGVVRSRTSWHFQTWRQAGCPSFFAHTEMREPNCPSTSSCRRLTHFRKRLVTCSYGLRILRDDSIMLPSPSSPTHRTHDFLFAGFAFRLTDGAGARFAAGTNVSMW